MDPIRSQRDIKIRPHRYLPDFDNSLYIDNSVLLTQPPEKIFETYFPMSGFCLSERQDVSVMDELLGVSIQGLDDQSRIFEQLNHYAVASPDILNDQVYWTAIMLRDHGNPKVREMLETWSAHVLRYSRRDQLSVTFAFRHVGLAPDVMKIDPESSWFHSWPHTAGRNRERWPRRPADSFSPPGAQIQYFERIKRQLEERNGQLEQAMEQKVQEHHHLVRAIDLKDEVIRQLQQAITTLSAKPRGAVVASIACRRMTEERLGCGDCVPPDFNCPAPRLAGPQEFAPSWYPTEL